MRLHALWVVSILTVLLPWTVLAQQAAAPTQGGGMGLLLAPKVGFFKTTNPLDGNVYVGGELGYVTPLLDSKLALTLEGSWHRGLIDGSFDDVRLEGGSGTFGMAERQLALMLSAVYREPGLLPGGVLYAGGGPGLFFHQVRTSAFDSIHVETQATPGFQLLFGGEYRLGPGGVFLEAQYRFTNVDFLTTGATNMGGFLLASMGYRIQL